MEEPDFSGWATKNDLRCSDGRTIKHGAFKHQDKQKVPLVWQHQHDAPGNILGHALLEDRAFGVYTHGYFNQTPAGLEARELVKHGDIDKLSIFASGLTQRGQDVLHGDIKEVSLVLAGANPGAFIESVYIKHGAQLDEVDGEGIIHTGLTFEHAISEEGETTVADEDKKSDLSVADVYNGMTEDQKAVVHILVAEAAGEESDDEKDDVKHSKTDETKSDKSEEKSDDKAEVKHTKTDEDKKDDEKSDDLAHSDSDKGDNKIMHTRIFEQNGQTVVAERPTLSHDQLRTIVQDAKRLGSLKESFLSHAEEYGITNIGLLFPDAKTIQTNPDFVKRRTEWVADVISKTNHVPFAAIKSIAADITAEEARAKGYITGNLKKDEVFTLLKRVTTPTTIYKKQKLDRDHIIDITDIDVVVWLKAEMRLMIDEELARAILIGDGRSSGSDDKVKDPQSGTDGAGIRSIANDVDFYAHKVEIPSGVTPEAQIDALIRARSAYKGSGTPTYYTTDPNIADLLLIRDKIGRRVYETMDALATALRVDRIVPVEVMETVPTLVGIMVNLADYSVGTNRGGELNFFDDFDLDYNQFKYLMETRLSGALTKPKSAVVVTRDAGDPATPVQPSFNSGTNTITIPTTTGIVYLIDDEPVTGNVVITEDTTVTAVSADDYYIPSGTTTSWNYTYNE